MDRKVFLHYVGKGIYSPKSFRQEALKYGVSRAIQIPLLRYMREGDIVLLATHIHKKRGGQFGRKFARVWGAFKVAGIILPRYLTLRLKKMGIIQFTPAPAGKEKIIKRGCGVMNIAGWFDTEDGYTLDDIFNALVELWETGEIEEGTKVFITGSFIDLPEFIIPHQEFTRGYKRLKEEVAYITENAKDQLRNIPDQGIRAVFDEGTYIRFRTKKEREKHYKGGRS